MSKKFVKIIALVLAFSVVFAFAACKKGGDKPAATGTDATDTDVTDTDAIIDGLSWKGEDGNYARQDDETVYEAVLGKYEELMNAAKAAETNDERFVLYAQAEAYLLDSAVMIPTTTQGGAYTISRVAPRTVPYVQWGNDDDRLHSMVLTNDDFLTPDERDQLLAAWEAAVKGEGEYDPAAMLTEMGHTLGRDYTLTFQTAPVTIDWLNTSSQSDTEITVNCVDGLVEYNNLGQMQPALAESWDVSDDGTVYTFHIRDGVKWYTSEGREYADLTAHDFEAGFRHMLDAQAGLEWLVDGVISGATAYYSEGGSWDDVGYKAIDDHTLQITLESDIPYFMTMLTYSCFLPICDSFYQSQGGVYGVEEYAAATAEGTTGYSFGQATNVASQVYCGPFLLQLLNKDSQILAVKNENYYKADTTTLNSIKWVFFDGSNYDAFYNDVLQGTYAGCALSQSTGLLEKAKKDGNFDKYAYVSDTTSTSFFGGLNLNRGTFALESGAVASSKDEAAKIDTATALINKNFRKALMHAFDKATFNATVRGDELKETNLRNMYTHPEFVQLADDVTVDGDSFSAGTQYGEIVAFYLAKLDPDIDVKDGVNGWFAPEAAKEYLAKAKEELGDTVTYPIQIDVVYHSADDADSAQSAAYKQVIEDCLGAENVQINLVEATTKDDFYACGYRAPDGKSGNYDMFYGSGWGPDFGDPCTYLDTFLGLGAGYMTKVIGLF